MQKNKTRDELDTLLERDHQLADKLEKAKRHLADNRDEVRIFTKRLEHQKNKHPSEEVKKEVQSLEKQLAQKSEAESQALEKEKGIETELERAQDETRAKKAELHAKLKELKAVQQTEVDQEERDLGSLNKVQEGNKGRQNKDDDKMAIVENERQNIVGRYEDRLEQQHSIGDDSEDLEKLHETVVALRHNVRLLRQSVEQHDHSKMAELHTKQIELAQRLAALRDAYSRGTGDQLPVSSDDLNALELENKELGKLLNDESSAGMAERNALLQAAEVQSTKNNTAMRMNQTETELKGQCVPVYLSLISGSCADTKSRRHHSSCLSAFL